MPVNAPRGVATVQARKDDPRSFLPGSERFSRAFTPDYARYSLKSEFTPGGLFTTTININIHIIYVYVALLRPFNCVGDNCS